MKLYLCVDNRGVPVLQDEDGKIVEGVTNISINYRSTDVSITLTGLPQLSLETEAGETIRGFEKTTSVTVPIVELSDVVIELPASFARIVGN